MNAYIYQAALYCERCGNEIRERLTADGKAPANPDDEITYDSDDFPKGRTPMAAARPTVRSTAIRATAIWRIQPRRMAPTTSASLSSTSSVPTTGPKM